MSNPYARLSRYSRLTVLLSYATLLIVLTLGTLVWPSCGRSPNWVVWGIQLLLMLVFLPGLVQQNVRTHAWLTFVLLGFFIASVSTAFACGSVLTIVEVFITVILFIAAMLFIRWRSKQLRADSTQ